MSVVDSTQSALLSAAIALSEKCKKSDSAFSVGAIIASPEGQIVSSGYSREFGRKWHAEEVALSKVSNNKLREAVLYSSLEPCSIRLSGKKSCCDLILESGITTVVFAAREPATFIIAKGVETLRARNIRVIECKKLAGHVRRINSHVWRA